jgi:hypothetical protein
MMCVWPSLGMIVTARVAQVYWILVSVILSMRYLRYPSRDSAKATIET